MTIFWCEDSLDGILTGIYDAWDSRLGHGNVKLKTDEQDTLELFCNYRQVKTDAVKAEKVLRTIRGRLGEEAFEAVCYAAACTDSRRADASRMRGSVPSVKTIFLGLFFRISMSFPNILHHASKSKLVLLTGISIIMVAFPGGNCKGRRIVFCRGGKKNSKGILKFPLY